MRNKPFRRINAVTQWIIHYLFFLCNVANKNNNIPYYYYLATTGEETMFNKSGGPRGRRRDTTESRRILEWLYRLRSAKLCALWTAQAFICANSLASVLRRAQSWRKTVLLRRLCAFHFLRRNSYLLRRNKRSLNQNSQFSPIWNYQLSPWAAPIRNYYST